MTWNEYRNCFCVSRWLPSSQWGLYCLPTLPAFVVVSIAQSSTFIHKVLNNCQFLEVKENQLKHYARIDIIHYYFFSTLGHQVWEAHQRHFEAKARYPLVKSSAHDHHTVTTTANTLISENITVTHAKQTFNSIPLAFTVLAPAAMSTISGSAAEEPRENIQNPHRKALRLRHQTLNLLAVRRPLHRCVS